MDNNSVKFWEGDEWKTRFYEEKKGSKILWLTITLLVTFYMAMLISSYFGEVGIFGLLLLLMVGFIGYKKYFTKWVKSNSQANDLIKLKDYYEEKNHKEIFWILVNSKTKKGTTHAINALKKLNISEEKIYDALEELTAYSLSGTEFSTVLGALSVVDHPGTIELMQTLKSVYPAQIVWIYQLQGKKVREQGFANYQEYMAEKKNTEEEE
ncbi:MAG: hypothetical protein ACTSYA_09205 [Candidatus Kariarchaeaceae archaeon]